MRVATHRAPHLVFGEHEFDVPLDHANPERGKLTVFAREVVTPDREHAELPWLVYFQGGPGSESPGMKGSLRALRMSVGSSIPRKCGLDAPRVQ